MSDCHSFCGAMPRKSVKKSIGDGDVSSTQSANNNKPDDAVIESPSSSSSGKKGGRGRQTESGSDYHGLPTNSKKGNRVPTVSDIIVDPITQLASEHWAGDVKGSYHPQMVNDIYQSEMLSGRSSRFQLLDVSGYMEGYLWPHFAKQVDLEHVFSIILIVNEKYKNSVAALEVLAQDEERCKIFYETVVELFLQQKIEGDFLMEQYYLFLINTFRSLENMTLRQCALRYLSLPIWDFLSKTRLTHELSGNEQLAAHWKSFANHKKSLTKSSTGPISASTPGKEKEPSAKKAKASSKRKRKADAAEEEPEATAEANSGSADELAEMLRDCSWFPAMLNAFLDDMCIDESTPLESSKVKCLERFAELLIDLLSQLPTRRFLKVLLDDMHFVLICRRSPVLSRLGSDLMGKLITNIDRYLHFEVDDLTSKALTPQDMLERNNARIHNLQQVAYADFPDTLKDLVFCSVGELSKKQQLLRHLQLLDQPQLMQLGRTLHVITDRDEEFFAQGAACARNSVLDLQREEVLWELLTDYLVPRPSHIEDLNMMPLYPTEALLWDADQLPLNSNHFGNEVLALPKLNLQFLSIHDYLLRNFTLFRLESAYEIRDDLMDAIKRVNPKMGMRGSVSFSGWARMALPIVSTTVDEVTKPRLGELLPRRVDCTVTVDVSRFNGEMRSEWEGFREHDVVFLICIENPLPDAAALLAEYDSKRRAQSASSKRNSEDTDAEEEFFDFARTFGVKHVRGGELFEFRDEANVVLNDPTRPDERKGGAVGTKRKLRLHLDPAQYYQDMRDGVDCYENLNLVVRRNAKENNFKAILQTIRELINTAAVGRAIPAWLHDVFLGYGNPASANFRSILADNAESIDYGDTFLDAQHVIDSFPKNNVVFANSESSSKQLPPPPYRITTSRPGCGSPSGSTRKKKSKSSKDQETVTYTKVSTTNTTLTVEPYNRSNRGPYPEDAILLNTVRFTPTQVEAIRSGTNPGLTMVVGPPGTGKTDVAVQIIVNLYRNHPTQKILIVTHSNAALNDLFEKIMERDVAPRHLLRLGSGEMELRETLATSGAGGGGKGQGEAFSKQGRVNWSLARRLQLLSQVQKLSVSIGVPGEMGNTCETAAYFQLEHVQSRIEKFNIAVSAAENQNYFASTGVEELFPFGAYFADAPAPLFNGDWEADLASARGCFRHIEKIFEELADYRAFELLRTQNLRSDFLLTKQARIVAMTCTHAAMTRGKLVELGFKYDSIVMEEAAQVLEVETLIPMLLQDTDPVDGCRLKRVVLIGDHHQLPPVVKHMAFQKFSKLDQSMFTRFVRLGVPTVQLDRQGRARADIAALYSWRYQHASCQLSNLPEVLHRAEFTSANPGFQHTFQFINVPDFQGKGESCPTAHFFQNLGEAEYVVAVYQYMRLLGYPAEKISILTTYNGQKQLIQDIVAQRCKNDMFGFPNAISTVDKFQGQQSDYILLSMVRTEAVGHIRDVRRLVVALSRARLGLYIFGRQALFENCYELSTAFNQLRSRPSSLQLVAGEGYPATLRLPDGVVKGDVAAHTVADVTAMGVLVYQMAQQAQGSKQSGAMQVQE